MDKQRKTIIYLIILALLIILTTMALLLNKKSTLSLKNTNFAFTDTQHVKKIFMADMLGKNVLLERTQNGWLVNGKYEANEDRIEMLLETIASIQVKNPVPLSTQDFVIRNMASGSIKVEIYTSKKKPVKVYYVGGATPDYLGTYMVLESKNKTPFVVFKPGLNGYLSEGYYYTDENEWRTKVVFNADPMKIVQVDVEYLPEPDSSFSLQSTPDQSYIIKPLGKKNIIHYELDLKKVRRFLMGFTNFQYMEVVEYKTKPNFKDSLLNSKPVVRVKLYLEGKSPKVLSLYSKEADEQTKSETKAGIDPGYFYAQVDDRPDQIFIMQELVLQRILWKFNDFKK